MKQTNYKKIYEHYWGVIVPTGFEVHHIDLNRENNDPKNLVALPRHLHIEYHKILSKLKNIPHKFIQKISLTYYSNDLHVYLISQLNDILKKCSDYIYMRDNKIQPNGTSF